MSSLAPPAAVVKIFEELSGSKGVVGVDGLQSFRSRQGDKAWSNEEVAALINRAAQSAVSQSHGGSLPAEAASSPPSSSSLLPQPTGATDKIVPGVSLAEFLQMLLDPAVTPPLLTETTQDMGAPLSHYFIYTSHNTYLGGNQLTSPSNTAAIVAALKRGVRVVELDLWPSSNKSEILVMHGGTLTKAVPFRACIEAIKMHAFDASPYPVIVTLEDHLPAPLQSAAAKVRNCRICGRFLAVCSLDRRPGVAPCAVCSTQSDPFLFPTSFALALSFLSCSLHLVLVITLLNFLSQIIKEVFGNVLYLPPGEKDPLSGGEFPSPQLLMHRIIISTKPPKSAEEIQQSMEAAQGSTHKEPEPSLFSSRKTSTPNERDKSPQLSSSPTSIPKGFVAAISAVFFEDAPKQRKKGVVEVKETEYEGLIAIRGGKLGGGSVDQALLAAGPVKRLSLSESQLAAVAKANPSSIISFTRNNLLRIFPTGLRFDSSNFDPMLAWSLGAQMVAANMQGHGKRLTLHHGFFLANGGCGYVKKPPYFFKDSQLSQAGEAGGQAKQGLINSATPSPPKLLLTVTVLLGLGWRDLLDNDQLQAPSFYVKISIAGVPGDDEHKKTELSKGSWTPRWESQRMEFALAAPDLALLRFVVREKDDTFAGQKVLPVSFLRPGLRCVELSDEEGVPLRLPRLLCKLELEQLPAH